MKTGPDREAGGPCGSHRRRRSRSLGAASPCVRVICALVEASPLVAPARGITPRSRWLQPSAHAVAARSTRGRACRSGAVASPCPPRRGWPACSRRPRRHAARCRPGPLIDGACRLGESKRGVPMGPSRGRGGLAPRLQQPRRPEGSAPRARSPGQSGTRPPAGGRARAWRADLRRQGLLNARVSPPRQSRALRALTRDRHRGLKNARGAVAHRMLVIVSHLVSRRTREVALGEDGFKRRRVQAPSQRLIRHLEALGLRVTVEGHEEAAEPSFVFIAGFRSYKRYNHSGR